MPDNPTIAPERAPARAGRLSVEDIMWLYDVIDEIKDELSELAGPM